MISLRKSSVGVYTYRTFYIHKMGEPGLRLFWIRWGRKGSHYGSLRTLCDLQGCSAGPLIFKNAFELVTHMPKLDFPQKSGFGALGGKLGGWGQYWAWIPTAGGTSRRRPSQAVTPWARAPPHLAHPLFPCLWLSGHRSAPCLQGMLGKGAPGFLLREGGVLWEIPQA